MNWPRVASSCAQVVFAIKIRFNNLPNVRNFLSGNETKRVTLLGVPLLPFSAETTKCCGCGDVLESVGPKLRGSMANLEKLTLTRVMIKSVERFFFDLCRVIVGMVDEHYVCYVKTDRRPTSTIMLKLWCIHRLMMYPAFQTSPL